jgi:hypothetical protein
VNGDASARAHVRGPTSSATRGGVEDDGPFAAREDRVEDDALLAQARVPTTCSPSLSISSVTSLAPGWSAPVVLR